MRVTEGGKAREEMKWGEGFSVLMGNISSYLISHTAHTKEGGQTHRGTGLARNQDMVQTSGIMKMS